MVAPFSKFYGKVWIGFYLNTEERFFLEVSFKSQQKEHSKTVISEANVKINRMMSTKWIYYKERSFASNF